MPKKNVLQTEPPPCVYHMQFSNPINDRHNSATTTTVYVGWLVLNTVERIT